MSFLTYKRHEENLQEQFGNVKISIEPITSVDMYYTDGDACKSIFKVMIGRFDTVYMPQMTCYNMANEHKEILNKWMAYVKLQENHSPDIDLEG